MREAKSEGVSSVLGRSTRLLGRCQLEASSLIDQTSPNNRRFTEGVHYYILHILQTVYNSTNVPWEAGEIRQSLWVLLYESIEILLVSLDPPDIFYRYTSKECRIAMSIHHSGYDKTNRLYFPNDRFSVTSGNELNDEFI